MTPSDLPSEPDPRLVELALRITDESPVDWESERHTAVDLSETLEYLREIQAVGREHRRRPTREGGSEEPAFIWGPLRAIEKLGEGGFGEVWRAWDPSLQREVALKLRRPGEAARAGGWLREAQRLARVRHPHVLTVYGADVHDGRAGIWTDLVRGRTLEHLLIENGPFGAREAAFIGLDLCAALAAVHAAGLVHGDVKTRNVIREGRPSDESRAEGAGRVVLMDFGTASEPEGDERAEPPSGGTPLYAAPEILAGEAASIASDLYALGVLLYRLVSGGYPIEAPTMGELRAQHASGPRPLRSLRPDLPTAFVRVIEQALAGDPAHRFRDAADMERALAAASLGTLVPERAQRRGARSRLAFAAGAAVVGACWLGQAFGPRWLGQHFEVAPRGLGVAVGTRQVFVGPERLGQFGYAVSASGDLDGDGRADLLIGAPAAAHDAGRAYLYRGLADGRFELATTFEALGPGGQLGFSVAHLGDINGDGRPDFAIGAPFASHAIDRSGQVLIYFGGRDLDATPDVVLQGARSHEDFGFCVAPIGDFNRDGYPDLAVGAPVDDLAGRETGRVFVYFGGPGFDDRPDLELSSVEANSQFGIALSGLGDFNGDGVDDLAVGANWGTDKDNAGRVFVYYGGKGFDRTPDLILEGTSAGSYFGNTVRGLGDFNGDGFADLAVGADFARGFERAAGSISLFFGGDKPSSRPALVLKGEHGNDLFGRVGPVTDFNGDGAPDLVTSAIGADGGNSGSGVAYVYFGGRVLDAKPDVLIASHPGDRFFGVSMATILGGRQGTLATLVVGAGGGSPGAVYVIDFSRYAFVRPRAGERWTAGQNAIVTWLGPERADLDWSPDGGRTWRPLAARVGGRPQNTIRITVPATAGQSVPLRLVANGLRTRSSAVETRVAIDSAR